MGKGARQKAGMPLRAVRYSAPMMLRFKTPNEEIWHCGKVENMSRTGVLFVAEYKLGIDASVEMALELPVQGRSGQTGNVHVVGKIVRTVLPASSDGMTAMAAHIQRYKMFPKGKIPSLRFSRFAMRSAMVGTTGKANKREEFER